MGVRVPVNRQELAFFLQRMKIQARLRAALEKRGYLETITPLLQPAPPPDPEIEPFITHYLPRLEPEPGATPLYLHTSPEFSMKRLLCRGLPAVYQITPVFRQGELGLTHSPEFTMVEWYRSGWTYTELMREVEEVIAEVTGSLLPVKGKDIPFSPPLPRISVAEAWKEAGLTLLSPGTVPEAQWRERFYRDFVDRVEPRLAQQGALFLVDFPAPLALLSRLKPEAPHLAERFELIVAGVELANGASELTSAEEYRRRMIQDQEIRRKRGHPVYPLPESFLRDLEKFGLPECAGVALGLDRLAWLASGAPRLADVQAFSFLQ